MQSLSFFSFLLRAPKEDKYTRSPRNVCAGGYGLNHRGPYNYLLLKILIILFYKTDCKTGTTIKMPNILFYKTDCKTGTTIKMPIILFYKTDCKTGTTIKMPIILFYKTDCKTGTTIKMP